jgi:hypothetical protein
MFVLPAEAGIHALVSTGSFSFVYAWTEIPLHAFGEDWFP